MADKGELISKPLGPEWLTSFSKDAQLDTTTDESSSGRQGQNANGRRVFFPDKMKPRVPLEMLGRSKSSPVLTQETTIPTIPKEVDVFTLLKEKNSFDKNFPTLHARKPASSQPVSITQPLNPSSLTTVEKEPQTAWKPPTASRASSTSQLPINTVTESKDKKIPTTEEKDIESKLHVPVHSVLPVPVTAKPRNKVELVSPKKPTPSSVKPLPPDSHSPKNRRFDPSLLRKACSEPNLPLNMVDAANYEIKLMPPKARPPSNLSSNRNDFFQNLIKKEQQRLAPSQISPTDTLRITPPVNQPQLKPTEECTAEFRGDSTNGTIDDVPQTNLPNDPQDDSDESQNNKLPQVSEEDEERFLRDLGWVPEEESHVPELTEEEILEVKNRLLDVKEHRSLPSAKLALDVSVKKWQHDKFFTPLSLSSVDAST